MELPRAKLGEARDKLKLALNHAGQLLDSPISGMAVARFESGSRATATLRALCRAYMREARRLGYDPWEFHESALCPGEFPEPACRDGEAELDRILGPRDSGRGTRDEQPAGVAR